MRLKPLSPKQRSFIKHSTAPVNVAEGAIRSGKTIAMMLRWENYNSHYAPIGSSLLMSGRTKDALWRNVLDDFITFVGPQNCRYNKQSGLLQYAGRNIWCIGANDEQAWEKIRGDTFAGWYADEVTLQPESFIKEAFGRLSEDPGQTFWTCNPDSPYHFLATEYIFNKALRVENFVKAWHFELKDNQTLTKRYLDSLERLYKGLWRKRLIEGKWVIAEGAIYDMLDVSDSSPQVIDDASVPSICNRRIVACDYATATVAVFLDIRQYGSTWIAVNEFYWDAKKQQKQLTDDDLVLKYEEFIKWDSALKPELVFVDSSATSLIASLRKRGHPAVTSNKEVVPGIRHVASLIGSSKLKFARRCRGLLRELSNYVWDPKAMKNGEDKPLKKDDHGPDALRYGLYTLHTQPRGIIAGGRY